MARWSDLDMTAGKATWLIPAEHAKNKRTHRVPVPPQLVSELQALPRLGPRLFTTNGTAPIAAFSKLKTRLDQLIAQSCEEQGVEPPADWRWHDIRRSAATGMADLGIAPHIIEACLNHISGAKGGVAGLYNRSTYDPECRQALEAWTAHLLSDEAGSNVVRMQRRP